MNAVQEIFEQATVWQRNPAVRLRRSSNDVSLVFIPGQNVVLELNAVAGAILDACVEPLSFVQLCERIELQYQVDDASAFQADMEQLFQRFVKHGVVLEAGEVVK